MPRAKLGQWLIYFTEGTGGLPGGGGPAHLSMVVPCLFIIYKIHSPDCIKDSC